MPPFLDFLLVLVVSVIDRDVGLNLDRRTANARLNGVSFRRLYFAHDTLLISTSSFMSDRLLKEIEEVSMQYGLRLGRGKCCFIAMNGSSQVRFHDGVKLQRKTQAVHLGHHLSQSMNIRQEVSLKLQQAQSFLKSFL